MLTMNDSKLDLMFNQSLLNPDDIEYPPLEMVDSIEVQGFLILLYSLTAVFSLLGNLTVIFVLLRGQRSSGDLRIYLINLAVSDMMMAAFSIPFTYTMFMLGRWIFPPLMCPLVVYFQHVTVLVSVYTLAAIGIDRYKAILHPFECRTTRTRSRLVLLIIWVAACGVSTTVLSVTRATPFKYAREWHWDCGEQWGSEMQSAQLYTLIVFVVTFGVPLILLAFTYSAVAWRLWQRASPGNAEPTRDRLQLRAKKKVVHMLVTIVVLFVACWLPLQIFLLLYYFVPGFDTFVTQGKRHTYAAVYFTCHWLACANSCVNPIVYCFMSDNFLTDLKELLGFKSRRNTSGESLRVHRVRSTSTRVTTLSRQRSSQRSTGQGVLTRVDHNMENGRRSLSTVHNYKSRDSETLF